ncbi:DUF6236 family protein [Winogradskyella sp. UBA3174]|uniref:DUF6236 family protein n=1 Tax=Winogradskyella sp. UBA3174 TaxID=1947785 RepID=UPI0025E408D4|nr:DUF6236 family protein [Winogradskyella sp. UBA3174]|tara:strand:- start:8 stop:874 length:867 start_codon:yes stop_codon:yes gene_type:complete
MNRGIITNPAIMDRNDSQSVSISGSISINDLNYYLLYWDKIVMPTNNIFHVGVHNEEELLKTKILERPRIAFSSWSTNTQNGSYDPFVIAQSIVANELISTDKTTDWTIHQIGDGIAIGDKQKKEFNSLKVELLKCLPVPNDNINFQEILDFKDKRKDELLELHSKIDELYLEILSSPDKDLKAKKIINELKNSIDKIDTVSKERFKSIIKYNLTTELNLNGKDLGIAIASGAIFDNYTSGFSLPIGTVVSGLLSLIKVKANRTASVEKAENKLKLSYLANANRKKII